MSENLRHGWKVTFGKNAARHLGQGIYPSGADLHKLDFAIHDMMARERQLWAVPNAKVVSSDGSVAKDLYLSDEGIERLGVTFRERAAISPSSTQTPTPAADFMLATLLQRYFDRNVWAARRECEGQIRVEALAANP